MTFGERLKYYRKQKKLTQKQLGAILGLSDATISAYEKDIHSPYVEGIKAIAEALDVAPELLLGTKQSKPITEVFEVVPVPPQGTRPIVGLASAGRGVIADEDIIGYEPVDARYDNDEYFYIRVKGDSMSPKIDDGDLVLVHRQTSVDSGSVGIFLVDGEDGYIKKVEYDTEYIHLISFNPYYPVIKFNGADVLRVRTIGKAVQIKRNL